MKILKIKARRAWHIKERKNLQRCYGCKSLDEAIKKELNNENRKDSN
jgi:hypothetical protein